MSEFYKAVFEEYQKRLQGYKDELFPFTPLSFIQIRQLAMLAATVAEEVAAQRRPQAIPAGVSVPGANSESGGG